MLHRSDDGVPYAEHREGDGEKMFVVTRKLGLEGIVYKRKELTRLTAQAARAVGSRWAIKAPAARALKTVHFNFLHAAGTCKIRGAVSQKRELNLIGRERCTE